MEKKTNSNEALIETSIKNGFITKNDIKAYFAEQENDSLISSKIGTNKRGPIKTLMINGVFTEEALRAYYEKHIKTANTPNTTDTTVGV